MEIFKIGDEITISGYKSITLDSDMQTNINNFAQINGIDKTEAERILNSVPAIKNFIANLSSQDDEEDYEIMGDFISENTGSELYKTAISATLTQADKTIVTNQTDSTEKTVAQNTTLYSQAELDEIATNIEDLKTQINEKFTDIYATENEFEQYSIQVEIEELIAQLKEKNIEYKQMLASNDGKTLSDTEINLISSLTDMNYSKESCDFTINVLNNQIDNIAAQLEGELSDEDAFILTQQYYAYESVKTQYDISFINIEKGINLLNKMFEILQKYPDNTQIQSIISQERELQYNLSDISSQKSEAIFIEDENTLNILEAQEQEINSQLKILEVNLQKEIAKEEGKTLSDDDIAKIEEEFDLNIFKDKVTETEVYLEYKSIGLCSSLSCAYQNEDEYALNIILQQQNDLNSLYAQVQQLENVTDATAGYAMLKSIMNSVSTSTQNGTATEETAEAEEVPATETAEEVQEAEKVTEAEEVTTATESESSTPVMHYAETSTNNNNTIKNMLGMFGLPITTEIPSADLIKDGNKITGFKLDGKTYQVIFDDDGSVLQTKVTGSDNNVISWKVFPADPLEQYYLDVEVAKDDLLSEIIPYLRCAKSDFSSYDEQKISDILDECVQDYKNQIGVGTFYMYFLTKLSDRLGYNIKAIRDNIQDGTTLGNQILEKFHTLLSVVDSGRALEEEAKQWTTEYVTVDGVKFRIKYLKTVGSNPCTITVKDGNIFVNGQNCQVDALGYGNIGDNLIINGENLVVNCNASTFGNITNKAKNSTLNGSFGDDIITNSSQGVGTTINAGDGDDMITNYANDAKLNGQAGNDTFINYANATIDGGAGDDVINAADNVRTTIIESEGDDKKYTFHVDEAEEPSNPSDDPDYPYCKDFTVCGVAFTVYSKTNDFSGVTYSYYKHLVTINASDVKIKIKSKTYDDTRIRLEGDSLNFVSNISLSSVFNYADNSVINGSSYDDALFNYADNVTVNGLDGKDRIINEGSNVTLDGGSEEDHIYNRQQDGTVNVNADSSDKVYNETSGTSRITISQGSLSDKEYNFTVAWAYIENALNSSNYIISSTISQDVYDNIQNLLSTLITTTDGEKTYSEAALKMIAYERNKSTDNTDLTSFELLKLALTEADTTSDGNITETELTAFISTLSSSDSSGGNTTTTTGNILGYNLPSLKDATIDSLSTSLKSTLGLTDKQMTSFINAQTSTTEALKILKQIQTIINMCSSSSVSVLDNIKSMMTDDTFNFNNEILEDAQMVVEALESDDYNSYIKNQMILDASSLSDSQILSQTSAGDVVQKADGNLYVNNGTTLKQLNISADTYLSLFPPVGRYFVEQNDYEDCFFLSTALIEGMENGASRAVLLQMFSEDSSGNITVKFPYIDYPVTFYGGQLKETDGKWTQVQNGETISLDWNDYERETTPATTLSTGLSMIEQAYALAKFAELSNAGISYDAIATYYSSPLAAAVDDAAITDTSTLDMDKALLFYYKGGFDDNVYEDLYGSTSSDHQSFTDCTTTAQKEAILLAAYNNSLLTNSVMTTRILGSVSTEDATKYNLGGGHQYAIESIDTTNKVVYVKNPWEGYMTIALPYDVFFEYFSDILYRTI